MKTTFIKLLGICGVVALLMPACKKNDLQVTSNGGQPGTLTASTTSPALSKANVASTTAVVTFNFTNANYGFAASVTNTLQIDAPGDNWKNPASVTLANGVLTQSYNTLDFDNLLLKLNLKGGVATTVNVRLVQSVSNQVTPIYSNVLSLNVTPFNLTSWIYVPGAYQGWDPTTADSLLSATSNGIYVGIINYTTGNLDFKITPAKTWTHSYGSTNNATIVYDGGNNITAPGAGQYLVTVNTNTNTITFQLADYYSIIGDGAIDWNTDIDMKYINDGNGNWVLSTNLNTTGAFKVRRDHDWTFSWGIPQAGSEGAGVANTLNDTKNDNITVKAAGTYKILFNAPATVKGAAGVTPPVSTTYSTTKTN